MAKRGSSPVLYELMRHGQPAASAPHGTRERDGAEGATQGRQSIRVPVGWFWLSAVAALALMVVAYQFGFARGERAGLSRGADHALSEAEQARLSTSIVDPQRGGSDAGSGSLPKAPGSTPASASETVRAVPTGDPRTRGWNYLVIARPGADEAEALGAFLKSNGLDAAIVSDHNPRFRKVIAVPGFAPGTSISAEPVKRLLARVKSVGQAWKNAARGNRDFDDAYLELFR